MDWSARDYLRFEDERTRPARDLLAAVSDADVRTAVDLGCGPGNSTELLVRRFPDASVEGVDSSPAMIEAARARLPDASFSLADIAAWEGEGSYDLIFANASLQWVPDHEELLPRLVSRLREGGTLAVQLPDNLGEPNHTAMAEAAKNGPWGDKLSEAEAARTRIHAPRHYWDLLSPLCRRVDVWLTVYHHPLAGVDALVDWLRATGLRPYLADLDEAERALFLARYRTMVAQSYPLAADGRLLLPFPRLFIVATR
ncbi:MAG TPA: trans-aconitate 2-methyltransferase [Mesorhizobium sp.]|jgi:trans-aconitate 2-methyltransferase|nr:trans-aconitate 2-methyltransferase [Mesorhizobium sp.]